MAIGDRGFPATTASFEIIREDDLYYVDKTHLIWPLANQSKVVFLSRPRRFGKSMLLDTIGCYLEGQRELFEGLQIMPLEEAKGDRAWVKHPVLRFDFSSRFGQMPGAMDRMVRTRVKETYMRLGLPVPAMADPCDIYDIILELQAQVGERVVVLIDEYDSPLLDMLVREDAEGLQMVKDYLQGFYRSLKSADRHLRFMMVTGISQFRQVGLFSGFNNIRDVSFSPDYNAVCGFTEEELRGTLGEPVARMAEANGLSVEEQLAALKYKYDGYRFSRKAEDVYNPFGLMNALMEREMQPYWSMVGTSTSADLLIPRYDALGIVKLDGQLQASQLDLARFDYERPAPIPFLYQAGYLTIKGLAEDGEFLLDFPNLEVRESIMLLLAPKTLGLMRGTEYNSLNRKLVRALNGRDIKTLEACMEAFLASLPYDREGDDEEAW